MVLGNKGIVCLGNRGPDSSYGGQPPGQGCWRHSSTVSAVCHVPPLPHSPALLAGADEGHTGNTDTTHSLSTPITPHTDADFLFRYLNPLSHSSMTSSHSLAQIVLQQSAEKGWESRVYRKCDFRVTTNAYTPLHMLSNYPTLFYINSHNLILISL